MRSLIAVGLCLLGSGGVHAGSPASKSVKGAPVTPAAPKGGIKTPGVQIPFESLKAETQISVETPGWIAIGDSILVPNMSKDSIARIDPKANKLLDPIAGIGKPCSGAIAAFGTWWIPSCGSQSVVRFDGKANKTTATLAVGRRSVRRKSEQDHRNARCRRRSYDHRTGRHVRQHLDDYGRQVNFDPHRS
jgi:hypothetical protein